MGGACDSEGPKRRRIGAEAKAAFVAALRRGERLEAAARVAGFSLQGFYGARQRDPVFAGAWQAALEDSASDERLVAPNNGRRLQRRRLRHMRFTAARQTIFIEHFLWSCDVRDAAAAAGVDPTTVYKHRLLNPDFAAAFERAIEQGYVLLEAEALRQRLQAQRQLREALDGGGQPPPETAAEFESVMKLLARWDRGGGRRGARTVAPDRRRAWTFAEAIEALESKLRHLGVPIPDLPAEFSRPDDGLPLPGGGDGERE